MFVAIRAVFSKCALRPLELNYLEFLAKGSSQDLMQTPTPVLQAAQEPFDEVPLVMLMHSMN